MFDRTYLTTGTELRRMLARAASTNTLHRLYWFVEVKLPQSAHPRYPDG
jgi:hypothetical protein